jgi:hypothetical protein
MQEQMGLPWLFTVHWVFSPQGEGEQTPPGFCSWRL